MVTLMDELKGKIIRYIYKDQDNTFILLITDDDLFLYYAFGDCCSESWIETIDNIDALIGEEVLSVEVRDLPDSIKNYDKGDYNDSIDIYCYTLKTVKGNTDIDFRNSNNGYYGGNFEYIKEFTVITPSLYEIKSLDFKFDTVKSIDIACRVHTEKMNPTLFPFRG